MWEEINLKSMDYKTSGVDIDAANDFIRMLAPMVRKTFRPEVLTDIGGFGALFSLNKENYRNPVLVSSTDGVGTKLKVAFMTGIHNTVGIDLVAMCVNDVLVQGAEPLFFLDYLAMGRLDPPVATQILEGIVQGCRDAACALVGGETAELPDMYRAGEYDLAGFSVGVVDRDAVIDGSSISVGDALIGIASTGLHSNGFSLVRKLFFRRLKWRVDQEVPDLGRTLGEELLAPTKIYVRSVLNLMRNFTVKGIAHVTGGGLTENLPRVLPEGCRAIVRKGSWTPQAIFELIRQRGKISQEEMFRVFNNGIGMVLVAPQSQCEEMILRLEALNERAFLIGEIDRRPPDASPLLYV
jgi:phosphoribosylformylglycinamidine cyclo-ligase